METYPCPLCGEPMQDFPDENGVYLRCMAPCVSYCHETVFGHGSKVKEAYEAACQKFQKPKE